MTRYSCVAQRVRDEIPSIEARAESLRTLLLSVPFLVDSVQIDDGVLTMGDQVGRADRRHTFLFVWWADAVPDTFVVPEPRSRRAVVQLQAGLWRDYLADSCLVVYCRGWTCQVKGDIDKRAVRDEISRARATAESRHWRGRYIRSGEDARWFRSPLTLVGSSEAGR